MVDFSFKMIKFALKLMNSVSKGGRAAREGRTGPVSRFCAWTTILDWFSIEFWLGNDDFRMHNVITQPHAPRDFRMHNVITQPHAAEQKTWIWIEIFDCLWSSGCLARARGPRE